MAINPYERRSFSEIAVATTLSGSINDTDLSCVLAASTGWPSGASGDFYIRVESEDIRVDTRTTTTLTFHANGRGANGTTAASHASGVAVTLVFTSYDADEANYAVEQTVGKIAAAGDLLTGSAANALQAITLGTTGLPLVAGASIPAYGQLGTSGIADDAITAAKIGADAVGSAEIAADSITTSELADDAVATANIAALAVTTAKINALAVTATELGANAVTTAKILDANVTEAKLAADSVTSAKIAAGTIVASDIADATITQAKFAAGILPSAVATSAPTGVAGQLWFDSDDLLLYVYNGTDWVCITPVSAVVATSQTTTSTSYTALATAGPAVTITTGTKALVTLSGQLSNSGVALCYMGFAVSGATTVAAQDALMISSSTPGGEIYSASRQVYVTGLTAGANVFTSVYKVQATTGTFATRSISVVGIP